MNDAALPRRHWREGVWQASLAAPLRRYIGSQSKLLQAGGAEILAVEAHLLVFVGRQPKHLERHMLEGSQQLRTVLQHQGAVGAENRSACRQAALRISCTGTAWLSTRQTDEAPPIAPSQPRK